MDGTVGPITEELIRKLHALLFTGPRARPTPYRDKRNAIRDAVSGAIVYLPPEATDVPPLMAVLVTSIAQAEREQTPAPVVAGWHTTSSSPPTLSTMAAGARW